MKTGTFCWLMLIIFLPSNNLLAQEESQDFKFGIESSAQSKYVWRGITYNKGLIIQPAISLSYKGLNSQFWGSYTVNDVDEDIGRHELDFILWYDYELEGFTISPAFNYYSYPGQEDAPTAELSLYFSYSFGNISLSTSITTDIKEASGAIAAYHEVNFEPVLSENLSMFFGFGIGWANKLFNEYYIGISKSTLGYILLKGAFNYNINSFLTVQPFVEYYLIADSEFQELLNKNVINYGIKFNLNF